jgi:diguanylate cyclase (GGDEF)-like protein
MTAYAVWMTVLIVSYFALPGQRIVTWTALGLSGVIAIVAGVVINRPARMMPWLLLAAANLSFATGQLIFLVYADVLHNHLPNPSAADVLYLATYPLYAAGLFIFIRWRTAGRDRRSLLDALTLTCGLALLSWVYLIFPLVHSAGLTSLQKAVSIAYPLGDVLVIAMLVRLLAPGGGRPWAVRLLALGTVGLLASDVSYGLIELYHPPFHNGTPADLGWALFYAAWGAAALHPTMVRLTEPVPAQQAESTRVRLSLLMLAALIAPVVLFAEGLEDGPPDAPVIAVFSAILYVLVLSRLADSAASQRRVLGRERVLRAAGASFAAAVTIEEAADAVRRSVATLTAPHPQREAMLAVRDGGVLRVVGVSPDASTSEMGRLDTMAETGLSLLAGPNPQLVRAAQLGERVAEDLAVTDSVLLCPLALKDRPSGDPLIGVLAVFGDERSLAALSGTLEILAGQAALAVERVLLNLQVNRRNSEEYFRTLVHDASDIILIIDESGNIRYATPSAKTMFGDVSVEGAHLWDLVRREESDDVIAAFKRMRDHEHRAFHDSLTGLPNRLLFHDRAAHALARARRNGTTVGVIFVDLDDFKVVNDTMGHSVGDELLIAAGLRLSAVVRESDTVARLGGDEFALLVEDAASGAVAEAFAEHIVRAFGEPFTLTGGSVITTATVGVATTEDSTDAGGLLSHADLALYAAKAAGKRQWRRYQAVLSAGVVKRRELQSAIADAVINTAFTLVFQPIVELASGEIVGFEALVRWPHPRWGMIQPDQFITLAEETGHIVPLGSWVLGQAAADTVRWQRRVPREKPLYISVNVSARQFRDPGFVDTVRQVLATSGLAPSALLLELTESVLLRRDDRVRADLEELKRIGVRLAIDDFGTGYSSLSYLRELPIDVLKIDKSFVEGIAISEQRLALAEVIIRIAKTLRLTVMAEGIENEVQRDLLISMGCQFGQGYLLARPVGADQAEALLRLGRGLVSELPRPGSLLRAFNRRELRPQFRPPGEAPGFGL